MPNILVCYVIDLQDGSVCMMDLGEDDFEEFKGNDDFIVIDIKNNKELTEIGWKSVVLKDKESGEEQENDGDIPYSGDTDE